MSTTSMAIFSNPLFATYSVYARNASTVQQSSHPLISAIHCLYTTVPFMLLAPQLISQYVDQ